MSTFDGLQADSEAVFMVTVGNALIVTVTAALAAVVQLPFVPYK
jgi:hypothetical protein